MGSEKSGRYDSHHEWMEWLDESNCWHPIDVSYTYSSEMDDIRYTNFIYGAEGHPYFRHLDNKTLQRGQPIILENGDVILYHFHPIFPGTHYGFHLVEDNYPDYFIIEKTMILIPKENWIFIKQNPD